MFIYVVSTLESYLQVSTIDMLDLVMKGLSTKTLLIILGDTYLALWKWSFPI